MAPEICHWIFKMNGLFPPFLPSFVLSPFFLSHLFLCWSDCYLEMFQKPCLWSTFLFMVPDPSSTLLLSFHWLSGERSCCAVSGSHGFWSQGQDGHVYLWCSFRAVTELTPCLKATNKRVCLKSPWLEETQVGMCWTHTPSALPGTWGLSLKMECVYRGRAIHQTIVKITCLFLQLLEVEHLCGDWSSYIPTVWPYDSMALLQQSPMSPSFSPFTESP